MTVPPQLLRGSLRPGLAAISLIQLGTVAGAVLDGVRGGNARRALGDFWKKVREQVADGSTELAAGQARAEKVERAAYAGGPASRDRELAELGAIAPLMLRGRTGLAKGAWLFVAVTSPAAVGA